MSQRASSELRTQLSAARTEYRAARYPGDLADALMPSRMRIGFAGRLAWTGVAAAAVAAVVVLAVWLRAPAGHGGATGRPTNEQWAMATPQETQATTPFTVAGATDDGSTEMPLAAAPPAVPSEVTSFVPSYTAMSVQSVPTFPTFDAAMESAREQQQNQTSSYSTTREAL